MAEILSTLQLFLCTVVSSQYCRVCSIFMMEVLVATEQHNHFMVTSLFDV